MSQAEPTRFRGRCKVLFLGVKPFTARELRRLVGLHFPLSTLTELAAEGSPHDWAAALDPRIPQFCFAEIGGPDDSVLKQVSDLRYYDTKLCIVCVLPNEEPDLMLLSLRAGATAFLVQPVSGESMEEAVQKLVRSAWQTPGLMTEATMGKVYSVMPAKGACGATTVACALVYELKRQGGSKLLLADLDPITGVVAFLLKIRSQHSFLDVLNRAQEMDDGLWKAMVVNRDGVDVLAAPETALDGAYNLTNAAPVLDSARFQYDVVVADAGYPYGEWSISQAQLSDEVLLVTTNELSALQATQRVLYDLEAHGIGRWKVRLVVNRYDPHVGLTHDKISRALHIDVSHVLPSDYAAVQRAQLEGRTAVRSSKFGRSMTEMARILSGKEQPEVSTPRLAGFRALFGRI